MIGDDLVADAVRWGSRARVRGVCVRARRAAAGLALVRTISGSRRGGAGPGAAARAKTAGKTLKDAGAGSSAARAAREPALAGTRAAVDLPASAGCV